jgi:cell division protein FtsL
MATLATRMDRFTTANSAPGDSSRTRVLDNGDPFEVPQFPNEDVYLYVKHIDNSRVLREADPAARKACWRLIGSSFAFAVLVIGLLLPSLNRLMAGYRMEALRQERQRLELDQASLELAETRLLSPARLEELARTQRFVDPAPEAVVYLDANKSDAILAKKQNPLPEPQP